MITIGVVCRIDKTENNDVYVFNKKLCDYYEIEALDNTLTIADYNSNNYYSFNKL